MGHVGRGRPKKMENIFKQDRPVPTHHRGQDTYDNPRENIDPHIVTKVIDTQELLVKGKAVTGASAIETLDGDIKGNSEGSTDFDFDLSGSFVVMKISGAYIIDLTDVDDTTKTKLVEFKITQDTLSGGNTITWDNAGRNNILFPGSVEPVLSSGPGDIDYFSFIWDGSKFIFKNAIFDIQN